VDTFFKDVCMSSIFFEGQKELSFPHRFFFVFLALEQRYPRRFKTPAKSGETAPDSGFISQPVENKFSLKTRGST